MEVIAEGLEFPEGPVVMADGSVIVVEIKGGRITRCWNGKSETICAIGGGPNGAAIGPDGALWVCNNGGIGATGPAAQGRIERVDLATGTFERVYDSCDGKPLQGPNDLVFDTYQARVYRYDARPEKQKPVFVANVTGPVGLDSLAVTAAGNICVATLGEGGISTVTPQGEVSLLPIPNEEYVTNIAFGGKDMRDAYITLSEQGRLVRMRWDEPGLELAYNG